MCRLSSPSEELAVSLDIFMSMFFFRTGAHGFVGRVALLNAFEVMLRVIY